MRRQTNWISLGLFVIGGLLMSAGIQEDSAAGGLVALIGLGYIFGGLLFTLAHTITEHVLGRLKSKYSSQEWDKKSNWFVWLLILIMFITLLLSVVLIFPGLVADIRMSYLINILIPVGIPIAMAFFIKRRNAKKESLTPPSTSSAPHDS
jgi:hypothetical protein